MQCVAAGAGGAPLVAACHLRSTPAWWCSALTPPPAHTQVAFLRDGGVIISDGYCNGRAARYTHAGAFHSEYTFEEAARRGGDSPGGGLGIAVAHSVAVDECGSRVYLADRENGRVLVFDLDTYALTSE